MFRIMTSASSALHDSSHQIVGVINDVCFQTLLVPELLHPSTNGAYIITGYHSGAVVKRMTAYDVASYIPEKRRRNRRAAELGGQTGRQQAVYAKPRRVRGEYGKSLLRRRGELVERSFAHCYETGAMRRCHLRGQENILKRQLVHVGAFNLT